MAAISSRRRGATADYTWPGYVDALTTLLMVLIFRPQGLFAEATEKRV